jgi:predicted RNA polymerase sigma factor
VLREELCLEAMRLAYLLIENEKTNLPEVNALLALFCFHSSRFNSRKNEQGDIVLYQDQDESLWDRELIARGAFHLQIASQGKTISKYHLEAGVAYWHTVKTDSLEKWESILQLYNRLLQMEYSPIAALNRTYALARARGNGVAIAEAEKLGLTDNPYYHSLLGELYRGLDDARALSHLRTALKIAKSGADKMILQKRIQQLAPET